MNSELVGVLSRLRPWRLCPRCWRGMALGNEFFTLRMWAAQGKAKKIRQSYTIMDNLSQQWKKSNQFNSQRVSPTSFRLSLSSVTIKRTICPRPQPSTAQNDAAKQHRSDDPGNGESCKNGFQCLELSSGWWFQPHWKIWKSVGMIIPNI